MEISVDPGKAASPLFRKCLSEYLGGHLIVSTGETEFDSPRRVDAPLRRGLKIVVTLSGRLSCRIDDRETSEIVGPNLCLFLADSASHQREQIFSAGSRLRYAIVQMSPTLIEEKFGLSYERFLAMGQRHDQGHDPVFLTGAADSAIRSIASKIMGCPLEGVSRDLYLIGKAFELAALAIAQLLPDARKGREGTLPLREIERIQAARDILLARYRDPPSHAALAREVGLNVRKLNNGFRQVFGTTAYAFLQEHRLQVAYRQIAGSERSISQVAYDVGYAPAHFATIFRRRFGLSPSELR